MDGVTFDIHKGETLGLVGESGSGKTTTARVILHLLPPTAGEVYFRGRDVLTIKDKNELREFRRKMQIIFQDPYEYLSPRKTVQQILAEPLKLYRLASGDELLSRVEETLELVELTPPGAFLGKYPHELSGGQRQRVLVARPLLLNPDFVVADEPVSMIDISIRIGILNLLLRLREKYNLTCLFITHDLAIARYVCNRIAVMYMGKIVEIGPAESVITDPVHPYSKALVSAVPVPNPRDRNPVVVVREALIGSLDTLSGCRFHPRCPYAIAGCDRQEPELREVKRNHFVACHLAT
ncbi:MAG: oligopeptide/dipeptide ABC transporter ATP-binding protein [Candidatus Bathyarchaeia archaeon]